VTAARDAEPLASVVGKNVDVLTNGVDTEYWRPSCEPEELHSIAFVGTMDAFSNSTAAIYFVNDILPLIHKEVPDARFYAIGKNPPPALQRLNAPPKVNVLGRVDDARQFIDKCEVVVSPLLMATGIQNKILEAMALNKPIVSTRIGIGDLMRFLEDEDVALADDKEEFAKRVVALLLHKDLRERTGKRGRLIVRQHYSWNAFGMRLRDVVEREIARNRKME
jgi:glycosyltransferase involved in cell wall biosynthesis